MRKHSILHAVFFLSIIIFNSLAKLPLNMLDYFRTVNFLAQPPFTMHILALSSSGSVLLPVLAQLLHLSNLLM